MPRTAALYLPAAVLLLAAWTRLESSSQEGSAVLLALLALGPALVRPWWGRVLAALVASVIARDYTVVMGVTIVLAVMIICLNLLVDIAHHMLDPRLREA